MHVWYECNYPPVFLLRFKTKKKTLISLLALAGAAMEDSDSTWNFHTTLYGQSISTTNGSGFTFSLAMDESDRYTSVAPDYEDFSVSQLTSIQILAKDNKLDSIPLTHSLIVVDEEGALMGVASFHPQHSGALNGLATTRMVCTFLFENAPVALSTDTTHYAYFVKKQQQMRWRGTLFWIIPISVIR